MADNKNEVKADTAKVDTKVNDTLPKSDTAKVADVVKVAEVVEIEQPKPTFTEPKPETLDDKIEKIVGSVINGLLPGLVAAIRSPVQTAKNVVRARRETERCLDCQQLKVACQGKHTKMICFPTRYSETGDYFRGCGLNGIWYLSNNENHYVIIPAEAEADFARQIRTYEEREVSSKNSRKGSWDFGVIGQGGKAKMPNPAKVGW